MDKDIYKSILQRYLTTALREESVVLLTDLTVSEASISDDDIHTYAREYWADEDVRRLYKKLSELLQKRLQMAVNSGVYDKTMGLRYLECFYDWRKKDDDDKVVKVVMEKVKYNGKEFELLERNGVVK